MLLETLRVDDGPVGTRQSPVFTCSSTALGVRSSVRLGAQAQASKGVKNML